MKTILEFTLPEDWSDMLLAVHGNDWANVVDDMDSWLRDKIKYKDRNDLQEVRDVLREFIESRNLSLDVMY